MTCKHRWEPSFFGMLYATPSHYRYQCARCGNVIWTTLNGLK